jgi:phosphohistidine phosphatase
MDIVLWRHADAAEAKNAGDPDTTRRLTSKGRKQAQAMAAWLDRHLPDSARILVSPARRAQETAAALGRKMVTVPALALGAPAASLLIAADWPGSRYPVVIVGHQPALGCVASLLLFGEEQELSMRKAAIWWLTNRSRKDVGDARALLTLRAAVCPECL